MAEDTKSLFLTNDVWLAGPVLQDLGFNENLDSAGNVSLEDEESMLTESEPYTTNQMKQLLNCNREEEKE